MGSLAGREVARLLLTREVGELREPAEVGAAIQRVCTRLSENLTGAIGADGYNALLARALVASPTGDRERLLADGNVATCFTNLVARVEQSGINAVTAESEMLIARVVDILGGLIGHDMVLNILDHDHPAHLSSNGRPKR